MIHKYSAPPPSHRTSAANSNGRSRPAKTPAADISTVSIATDWQATALTSQPPLRPSAKLFDGERGEHAVERHEPEHSSSDPKHGCNLGCIHQQHELRAENGGGRHGGEEAHSAAMASDVGGECPRVTPDARASRRRQPGEK